MKKHIAEEVRSMQPGEFERLIYELMPKAYESYSNIQPTFNSRGKTTKSCVDLYVHHQETDTYIAFLCTTQQNDVKAKIINDINNLNSENCHIKNKIADVVLCVNTPIKTELEDYRNECKKFGWNCINFSLHNIVDKLIEHPKVMDVFFANCLEQFKQHYMEKDMGSNNKDSDESYYTEKMFSCGARVQEIRKDINLSTSRFIDLIEFNSEKHLLAIEKDEFEVSATQIENICNRTGVSNRWLKHSEGSKYEYQVIHTYELEVVDRIKQFKPNSIYFMINKDNMAPLLLVNIDSYSWKIYTFTFNIDFWDWFGDGHYIPQIYSLFTILHIEFNTSIKGRIIDSGTYDTIVSGDTHMSPLISSINNEGLYWFDDLMDIDHKYPISKDYNNIYGKWFIDIQDYFRRYRKSSENE